MAEYPEIIKELIKEAASDKITRFDLPACMPQKPLKDIRKKLDPVMRFFSVYVIVEPLMDELWEDSRYRLTEKVRLCSLVEEKARRYWMARNREHLKLIDDRVESLRNDPEYKRVKEADLIDRVVKDLNQEIYPEMIERLKQEYQWIYEDEWEEYWIKEDPFKERIEYHYHRRYDMPPPFNRWDRRNLWQQFYFGKSKNGIFYYEQGGSGDSNQRYLHGFYGHLFALLNKEKPVPTYFFSYDSRNRFRFERSEKRLWLNFFNLAGNFQIDREESRRILKGVNKIEMKSTL